MMGSLATARLGSISSSTACGSCRSSSSQPGRVRASRGRLGRRETSDLAVAQAVEDERENLAGQRDAGLVAAAALGELVVLAGEDGTAVIAADALGTRGGEQPA